MINELITRKLKVAAKGDGSFVIMESTVSELPVGLPIDSSRLTQAMTEGILVETMSDGGTEDDMLLKG